MGSCKVSFVRYRWRRLLGQTCAQEQGGQIEKIPRTNFAKRTHLSHVKSVICVFQDWRKQGDFGAIWGKRCGGT
jgi:hypothetical protein